MSVNEAPVQQREQIWKAVQSIPAGHVLSYGEVAKRACVPKALSFTTTASIGNGSAGGSTIKTG